MQAQIDEHTRLVLAHRWLDPQEATLRVGSLDFGIRHVGPAHTRQNLVAYLVAYLVT